MSEKIYFTEVVLLTKSYNLQDFKDWLHWHLDIIGFDHAHIFDNESSVDIKTVCDSYGDKVSYELVKGWPNQYALYNRYINNESKAWWVLPIDDDEFLYIGEKYNHNVMDMLLALDQKYKMNKLSIQWRNMFPFEYTKTRTKSLIENCNAWSNEACSAIFPLWRQDNRWIKTFTKNTGNWYWGIPHNGGHNPSHCATKVDSVMPDGRIVKNSADNIGSPINSFNDVYIAHCQYKSDDEWQMKCTKRISAANKSFNKNKPKVFSELYKHKDKFNKCEDLIKIWNG